MKEFANTLGITEAGLYQVAMVIYDEYIRSESEIPFQERCLHKFDSIEDEFLQGEHYMNELHKRESQVTNDLL